HLGGLGRKRLDAIDAVERRMPHTNDPPGRCHAFVQRREALKTPWKMPPVRTIMPAMGKGKTSALASLIQARPPAVSFGQRFQDWPRIGYGWRLGVRAGQARARG